MNICFFGIYDLKYSRNRVLIAGLQQNGSRVVQCTVDPRVHRGMRKYTELVRAFRALPEKQFDMVIVAFPGHTVVWLAKTLFRGTPVVFDMFVSLYNSNVEDRKRYGKYSLRAWRDRFLDWYSCALADKVLLDTHAHIRYVTTTYCCNPRKFIRVFVGTDDAVFFPGEQPSPDQFLVHFHGSFIPLQGVGVIVRAAKLLETEGVSFRLIGDGPEHAQAVALAESLGLSNVAFIQRVPYEDLRTIMNESHVCLGIFGNTAKAQMVIPNKVYEALACGRPIVTARSDASQELLEDQVTACLVPAGDPEALADAIRKIRADGVLSEDLSKGGRLLFESRLTPQAVTQGILEGLEDVI